MFNKAYIAAFIRSGAKRKIPSLELSQSRGFLIEVLVGEISSLTINEISAECGYNDPNFFIRTFKRQEGMTPGEFRRKW